MGLDYLAFVDFIIENLNIQITKEKLILNQFEATKTTIEMNKSPNRYLGKIIDVNKKKIKPFTEKQAE